MPNPFAIPGTHYLSRKGLARFSFCLAIAYVSLVLVLMSIEDCLVFHPYSPQRRWAEPPADCETHDLYLHTADGTQIHARWYPCRSARGAALVCHSRAGNLSLAVRAQDVRRWHEEVGVSVLVFDYPGYGRSHGSPSEAGCYAAADAAYDWLAQTQHIAPENLLLVGRSLGTGVAVDLASRRPHRALVLISPFTSVPDVAHHLCPVLPTRALMRNRFDSLARIGACTRPLLVFHGTADNVVPFALGKRLFAAARAPKRFIRVEGAGHRDAVPPAFYVEVRRFLADMAAGAGRQYGRAALAGVVGEPNISPEAPRGPCEACLARRAALGTADRPGGRMGPRDERASDDDSPARTQRHRP
jgi:pimeloyl-ACP methyl ester carboxylesterase